jgi:hypothetical protein
MKKLLLLAGVACLLCQCSKNTGTFNENFQPALITQARNYFLQHIETAVPVNTAANPRNTRTKVRPAAVWDAAYTIPFRNGEAVVVPLHYPKEQFLKTNVGGNNSFKLDDAATLLLYRDSVTAWHAELVTALPDTAFLKSPYTGRFSGIILVDDWWGNPLHKFRFDPSGNIRQPGSRPGTAATPLSSPGHAADVSNAWEEQCYFMDGYNYSSGDPEGYYWSEFLGCNYTQVDGGAGGYSGYSGPALKLLGGGVGPPKTIPLHQRDMSAPPTNPIADVRDYFKCFQNVPGATYEATICVNQPAPGTRTPWVFALNTGSSGGTSPVNVGHTFLVLKETLPGSDIPIVRNVGFYPAIKTTPFDDGGVQGVLNNDDGHEYDISGGFTVTSGDLFFNILSYVMTGNDIGYQYNINSNNCTTFAIDALAAGHIYVPSTTGYWVGGLGNDPGDLGEDLRNSTITGMTRGTGDLSHPNSGYCN